MPHERILQRERSVLLLIDLQEAYRGKLFQEERVVSAAQRLLEAAALLDVPVLVTEQYPQGLGHTFEELERHLDPRTPRFEKTRFSALGAPGFAEKLGQLARDQVVVAGIETHVCVSQSVHDLLEARYRVHVVRDAITARFTLEDEIGWQKIVESGAVPASVESGLFEWLGDAQAPEFKTVRGLVL